MRIDDLMASSGVGFGTSGARGLVADMSDQVCYAYTLAFLQHLQAQGGLASDGAVGIAGDLRASSPRIMAACAAAVSDFGGRPQNHGFIPSPAIANFGLLRAMPTLMVTGSHIPDDRNGIKFNRIDGEILKADEQAIRAQQVELPTARFDDAGALQGEPLAELPALQPDAEQAYLRRYLDFFAADCLAGLKVAVYQHSSVARDPYATVLSGLGAEVVALGRTDEFMPVDTEAIRTEDIELARQWSREGAYDAIVSADGDGDRPLVSDEQGRWLRGDVAGVLCAHYLAIAGLVTPVSSNTVVERSAWFERVERTRIGSPYVIEGMDELVAAGLSPVAGYEANGGFLLASPLQRDGKRLSALPTRDALIVAIAVLALARQRGGTVSALSAELPQRFTFSDRIKAFPTELSQARIGALAGADGAGDIAALQAWFGDAFGQVSGVDTTDGLRVSFDSGEVAHLRPSGNAPELRAYTEAASEQRATQMNAICMQKLAAWREQ